MAQAVRTVIRRARKAKKLKQKQIAKRVGCHQSRISNMETEVRASIDVPEFVAIAKAIGVDPGELLNEAIRLADELTIASPSRPRRPPRKTARKGKRG